MSYNNMTGDFPLDYFTKDTFLKLEFFNVNYNFKATEQLEDFVDENGGTYQKKVVSIYPSIIVPEVCIRLYYCYKKVLMNAEVNLPKRSGNDNPAIASD